MVNDIDIDNLVNNYISNNWDGDDGDRIRSSGSDTISDIDDLFDR